MITAQDLPPNQAKPHSSIEQEEFMKPCSFLAEELLESEGYWDRECQFSYKSGPC